MAKVHPSKDVLVAGLLLATAVAGTAFLLWLTPHGIGLYYDSMEYLEAAENCAAGKGLGRVTCSTFKPLTRYPPLYPLLLAVSRIAQVDVAVAAHYMSAMSLGLVSILVGASVWRVTRSRILMLAGACLAVVSPPVLNVFSWAMSEPLYLVLLLSSILVMDVYLISGRRLDLVSSAALSGLLFLTRYVGALPILANTVFLLAQAVRRRISWRDVGTYLVVSCVPMVVWLARGVLVAGNPTSRILAFHLPERQVLRQGANTIIGWFVPVGAFRSEEEIAAALAGIGVVLAILYLIPNWRASVRGPKPSITDLHALAGISYFGGVMISITLFDAKTPLDDRILIPVYVSMVVVLLASLAGAIRSRSTAMVGLALAAILTLAARQLSQVDGVASQLRSDGQGYAASRWTTSDVARRLRELQPSAIYTNDITAVFFVAHAASCAVPTRTAEASLAAMRLRLREENTVVAIFGDLSSEFMPLERLTEGLVVMDELQDGAIYKTASPVDR